GIAHGDEAGRGGCDSYLLRGGCGAVVARKVVQLVWEDRLQSGQHLRRILQGSHIHRGTCDYLSNRYKRGKAMQESAYERSSRRMSTDFTGADASCFGEPEC